MTRSRRDSSRRETLPDRESIPRGVLRRERRDAEQTGRLGSVERSEATLRSLPPERDRGTLTMLAGPTTGAVLPLDAASSTLGRATDAGLRIQDPGISRVHARIFRAGSTFCIEDLGSGNGTFVSGRRIEGARELEPGDRVQLGGNVLLRFDLHDELEQNVLVELYRSAVRDPLTRTYNRRYFDERLHGELSYARRNERDLALLIMDIDHFKDVNDRYGHRAGDNVLRVVGALLQRMLRPEDLLARWGGEEFAVVARGLDSRNAAILAERIRHAVEELRIPWQDEELQITVSVGTTSLETRRRASAERLVADADLALYRAKEDGRNRCRTFTTD